MPNSERDQIVFSRGLDWAKAELTSVKEGDAYRSTFSVPYLPGYVTLDLSEFGVRAEPLGPQPQARDERPK